MVEEEPRLLLPPQLPEEEEAVDMDGARHTLTRHTQCRTHTLTEEEEVVVVELPPLLLVLLLLVAEEEEDGECDRTSNRRCRTGTPRCTHTAAMAVAEVLPLLPPQLLPAAAAVDLVDHTAAGAAVAEVLLPLLPPQLLRAAAAVDLVDRTVSAVSRRRLSWLRLRSLPDD